MSCKLFNSFPRSTDLDHPKRASRGRTYHATANSTLCELYRLHNKIIILFLGRLHAIKGIEFLLRSYAPLSQEFQNTVSVIAGPDGGYAKRARELIAALHLHDDVPSP